MGILLRSWLPLTSTSVLELYACSYRNKKVQETQQEHPNDKKSEIQRDEGGAKDRILNPRISSPIPLWAVRYKHNGKNQINKEAIY